MNITLAEYIASNNPSGVDRLLDKRGFPYESSNYYVRVEAIKHLLRKKDVSALQDLAEIHPDIELLKQAGVLKPEVIEKEVPVYNNATGTSEKKEEKKGLDITAVGTIAAIGGFTLLGLALILKLSNK